MNPSLKFYLLVTVFFIQFLSSCKEKANRDTLKIDPLPQASVLKDTPAEQDISKVPIASMNRVAWQKPEKILNRLGTDLHHKVIADIGAGPTGFFTFWAARNGAHVIAVDISSDALRYIEIEKAKADTSIQALIQTRMAKPQDPLLNPNEVDGIMIVNTIAFIPDKLKYLSHLRGSMKDGAKLVIVDFKMKRMPEQIAPPKSQRVHADIIEELLYKSGYSNIKVDDQELAYQFIITADK
ncbi:MAG: methyltransferase domain-containing protein [Saprospiraceae bacterium]